MRLASSDTADREAFDAALDATPLGSFRDAGESLVHRHSLLQARPPGSSPAWPRQWTAATRKERSYPDRVAIGSNRPFAALQARPSERDGSARERASA
jgi:hypothetical protein